MQYQKPIRLFAVLTVLILITQLGFVSAQVVGTDQPAKPFSREIEAGDISSEMRRRWDFSLNPLLGANRTEATTKLVRIVYLVPTDKVLRNDYRNAITTSTLHLQNFYTSEMGNGLHFTLRSPVVETFQLAHDSAYYKSHQSAPNAPQWLWFWENVLNEAFVLTGGGFNDPNNRWIFHIDADCACGQVIGGNSGVSVMAANDFRGLTGEQNIPACPAEPPDNSGYFRWVGGAAHEIGHSFNLPHPPGCGGPGGCTGGTTAANSLMWFGYALYPNTYLLPSDKQTLLNSGFFTNAVSVTVSGRVTRGDGRGVAGARMILTNQSETRYALTNHFGYYRFIGVPGGASYFVLAEHKSHVFNPREITPNADLTNVDFVAQ